ncbi:MAG: Arc family DNA-binding protein [Acidobacteriota bacterium]|nr:Arc family DNA-binding protein [Acidobacteriota bacterium]
MAEEIKTSGEKSEEVAFNLRLERELYEKIAVAADEQKRSRNGQIVFVLEDYFRAQNGKVEKSL